MLSRDLAGKSRNSKAGLGVLALTATSLIHATGFAARLPQPQRQKSQESIEALPQDPMQPANAALPTAQDADEPPIAGSYEVRTHLGFLPVDAACGSGHAVATTGVSFTYSPASLLAVDAMFSYARDLSFPWGGRQYCATHLMAHAPRRKHGPLSVGAAVRLRPMHLWSFQSRRRALKLARHDVSISLGLGHIFSARRLFSQDSSLSSAEAFLGYELHKRRFNFLIQGGAVSFRDHAVSGSPETQMALSFRLAGGLSF